MRQRLVDATELRKKWYDEGYIMHESGMRYCELDWQEIYDEFIADLDSMPTVDAVEVVRCKDCFHYWDGVCKAHIDVIYTDENEFCSWGERREDEGKNKNSEFRND